MQPYLLVAFDLKFTQASFIFNERADATNVRK